MIYPCYSGDTQVVHLQNYSDGSKFDLKVNNNSELYAEKKEIKLNNIGKLIQLDQAMI